MMPGIDGLVARSLPSSVHFGCTDLSHAAPCITTRGRCPSGSMLRDDNGVGTREGAGVVGEGGETQEDLSGKPMEQ
eukprot:357733-Chlamydomonas_euryale.AAC.2